MQLRTKTVHGKKYYYFELSYRVLSKLKTFTKYVGAKKPSKTELAEIDKFFKSETILKLSGKKYENEFISKDDLIKALLVLLGFPVG